MIPFDLRSPETGEPLKPDTAHSLRDAKSGHHPIGRGRAGDELRRLAHIRFSCTLASSLAATSLRSL